MINDVPSICEEPGRGILMWVRETRTRSNVVGKYFNTGAWGHEPWPNIKTKKPLRVSGVFEVESGFEPL